MIHRFGDYELDKQLYQLRRAGVGIAVIIFAIAAGAAIPGIGAFHHPALGQWRKARAPIRAFFHFAPPAGALLHEPSLPTEKLYAVEDSKH